MRKMRIFKLLLICGTLGSLMCVYIADNLISSKTQDNFFDNIELLPENNVGLSLGTSKFIRKKIIINEL